MDRSESMRLTGIGAVAVLAVGLALTIGCKSQEVVCHWAAKPIQIDGEIGDWEGAPAAILQEDEALLALSNDAERLYVHLRTRNSQVVRSIRMTGVTLYLNKQGNKDRDFFIRYRGGPSFEELRSMAGPGGGRPRGGGRQQFEDRSPFGDRFDWMEADSLPPFTCFQKDRIIEKPIPTDGSQGPSAAYDTSHSFFSYEFSIPLGESFVRYYGLGVEPGQKIGIGVEWGDMGQFGRGQGSSRPPPSISVDGIGGGRGMPGGAMRGSSPDGWERMQPEKREIWLKVKLAVNPSQQSSS